LAGNEASSSKCVAEARELTEQNLSPSQLLDFMPFDRTFVIKTFAASTGKQSQSQSAGNSLGLGTYATSMFLNQLLSECKDPSEISLLCGALKDAQAACALKLRPSQLENIDPSRKVTNYTIVSSVTPNSSTSRIVTSQIDFPSPSALQSEDLLTVLHALHKTDNANIKQAAKKQLAEDAELPDEDILRSAINRLCYATWLWWDGQKEDAINQMTEFRKLGVARDVGIILESVMLIDTGKGEAAIELMDSMNPTNPHLLEFRELRIMNLALLTGKTDRAQLAAQRLYAMPLKSSTQLRVSDVMEHLGMPVLSAAIIERLRFGNATDLTTLFELMTKLQKSNNTDDKEAAVDIAWKIYQRTQPQTQSLGQSRQAAVGKSSGQGFREQAVRLLIESGKTDSLIKSLEERLKWAPDNESTIHQLAELYRGTGKQSDAQTMLNQIMPTQLPNGSYSNVSTMGSKEYEELLAKTTAKQRFDVLKELMLNESIGWERVLKSLSAEIFVRGASDDLSQTIATNRRSVVNSKLVNMLLAVISTDPQELKANVKCALQQWTDRIAANTEGKVGLRKFLTDSMAIPATKRSLGQLVVLLCIAGSADDKDVALQIAQSIVSHPNASFSVAALASSDRESVWAAVPVVVKLGEADLAVKLAQIAMKPTSDASTEALRLRLELANLQFDVGKSSDAEVTLRKIIERLSLPSESEFELRSELALKLATLAAKKGEFDISFEATRRASVLSMTGSQRFNESILRLIDLWQEQHAPTDRVYETIKEVVFRSGDLNHRRLYPEVRRNYGESHDFTFPDTQLRPLAFVLVDLAKANNSIPALVEKLDFYAEKPLFRLVSLMMKAYALRTLGKTSEATKLIDEAIDTPKSVPEEIMLLYALTSPIPGGDQSTVVPQDVAGPILKKFLNERIMHTGTRMALLSQLRNCIAADDRVMLECYVSAVADAIPKVKSYDGESLKLMLSQFYKYLAIECKAQGKMELAAEYLQRADTK
jgi:tetratricopeptide (TPR) repeat protein